MDNQPHLGITDRESRIQILKAVSSNGIGAFSFGIFQYGMSFMLLNETHSPLSFGMGLTVAPLVALLFFIPIGNFVDNHDHKRIIFWGYILRLIGFALLGLALPHFKGMELLIPFAIFIAMDSLLVNLRNTAYSASVRQLVRNSQVQILSSYTTACASASRILSPVFGVIIYSLISVEGLIIIEMIATIIATLIMMSLHFYVDKRPAERTGHKTSQFQQFKEAIHYMKKRPFIRDTIIAEIVVNFLFTAVVTGSPFIIQNELHLGNGTVTLVETGYSIGYLLGSLLTSRMKNQEHYAKKIIISLFFIAVAIGGLGFVFAFSRTPLIVGIIGLLFALMMDFAFAVFDLAIEIRLQMTVHTSILGRVSSTLYTTSYAIMPIGTLVYTVLFDVFANGSLIIIISGIILMIYTLVSVSTLVRDVRKDDQYVAQHRKSLG
ncbi:MFS transporter [Lactobacillaceae bacterium Melli_B4]